MQPTEPKVTATDAFVAVIVTGVIVICAVESVKLSPTTSAGSLHDELAVMSSNWLLSAFDGEPWCTTTPFITLALLASPASKPTGRRNST